MPGIQRAILDINQYQWYISSIDIVFRLAEVFIHSECHGFLKNIERGKTMAMNADGNKKPVSGAWALIIFGSLIGFVYLLGFLI